MESFNPTDMKAKPLDENELANAMADLVTPNSKTYPKVNRKFIDPQKPGEPKFALFTYIKSKDATPDKQGFFGVAKIRGVFYTPEEAALRAEEIVKDVDSANSIYTCVVGHPFPLVCSGYAEEVTEVDLQNKTEVAISENVREKRSKEQKEIAEINERKENLMRDVDPKTDKSEDKYVEQRVKLAHLKYCIGEHQVKREECIELKKKVLEFLRSESAAHPEYEEKYLERYKAGRRAAHIPEDTDLTGMMKFMADKLDAED